MSRSLLRGAITMCASRIPMACRSPCFNPRIKRVEMFEPVNDLEKSLMNAATNPAARPQFCRDILESSIYIINQADDKLNIQNNVLQAGAQLHIQSFEHNGQAWLPIFTALQRLLEYIR